MNRKSLHIIVLFSAFVLLSHSSLFAQGQSNFSQEEIGPQTDYTNIADEIKFVTSHDEETTRGNPKIDLDPEAGIKLMEKYGQLLEPVSEEGILYYAIHEGSGKQPEYGSVVYFMLKAYNPEGGEIYLGDSDHSHPSNTSEAHSHVSSRYNAKWTFFGAGGGTVSLGLPHMEELLYDIVGSMREMGTSLVYIPSELAYGSEGYVGHEFSVEPDTDLLLRVTLLRVRKVYLPEDVGFNVPTADFGHSTTAHHSHDHGADGHTHDHGEDHDHSHDHTHDHDHEHPHEVDGQ